MEYKLLNNYTALFPIEPEIVQGTLKLVVKGGGKKVALVNEQNRELYKKLENGECEIPFSFLIGRITVRVTDGDKVWDCGEIVAVETNSTVVVSPIYPSIFEELNRLKVEVNNLRQSNEEMTKYLKIVQPSIEKFVHGGKFF